MLDDLVHATELPYRIYHTKVYTLGLEGQEVGNGSMRFNLSPEYEATVSVELEAIPATAKEPEKILYRFGIVASPPRHVPWNLTVIADGHLEEQNMTFRKYHCFTNYRTEKLSGRVVKDCGLKIYARGTVSQCKLVKREPPKVPTPPEDCENLLEITVWPDMLTAQSGYFRAMLSSGMLEAQQMKCRYDDLDPALFNRFIRYLSSAKPEVFNFEGIGPNYTILLFMWADRFDIPMLMHLCELRLLELIDDENCRGILKAALQVTSSLHFRGCIQRFLKIRGIPHKPVFDQNFDHRCSECR